MLKVLRLAAVHIALAAMVLRAFLPAGWMPNTAGSSNAPIVICTMNGPMQAGATPGNTHHMPVHDDGHQNDVCPFAASVHVAAPVSTASLLPPVRIAWTAWEHPAALPIHIAARYAPQSSRAPPAFA